MSTEIREARVDDADFLAWILLHSHRSHLEHGFWDFLVGGSEQKCLEFLNRLVVTSARHWAHYSTFIVAEIDGQPAGALSGFFEAELGRSAMAKVLPNVFDAVGLTFSEYARGIKRAGTIVQCAPDHAEATWIIENVATRPEFRGRGLTYALLDGILEAGVKHGASIAGTGVLIGNDAAQHVYEEAGFRVFGEKLHPEFEAVYGCPGIKGLRRDL